MTREQLDAIRARMTFEYGPHTDVREILHATKDLHALLAEIEGMRESCTGLVKQNERQYDEVLRLTAEVEAKVAQNVALIGQNGKLQLEVERLTADPLPAAAWVREVERAAFARGVAAMREALLQRFDWHGDVADRIRAEPVPEYEP